MSIVQVRVRKPALEQRAEDQQLLLENLPFCLAKHLTIMLLQYCACCVEDRNVQLWQEKLGLNGTSQHGAEVALSTSGFTSSTHAQ
jgi:hypothetical protein